MPDGDDGMAAIEVEILLPVVVPHSATLSSDDINVEKGIYVKQFHNVKSLKSPAKLQKKVVVTKRFWKINAIRPKIKAIKGKTRNFKLKEKAN